VSFIPLLEYEKDRNKELESLTKIISGLWLFGLLLYQVRVTGSSSTGN
jgi:hypothetical protein